MEESLLEEVSLTPLYIGYPFDKGLLLCLHHTRRRAKCYLIMYRYMSTWVELYSRVAKAISFWTDPYIAL